MANTKITLLGVAAVAAIAACEPGHLTSTECASHADCSACSSCENGACVADPAREQSTACFQEERRGRGGVTTLPDDTGMDPETTRPTTAGELRGIWTGTIEIDHPGWAGGPIDQMTLAFDDEGRVRFYRIADFRHEASFGTPPNELPMSGTAIAHVLKGDGFLLEFTVLEARYEASSFTLRWRALSTAETPATPPTDYTVSIEGVLSGSDLHITYSLEGTQYTANVQALANGVLRRADAPSPNTNPRIWRGAIEIEHPGYAGPPIDFLTIRFDELGRVSSYQFDEFDLQAVFGTPPEEYPFAGSAIARLNPGGEFRMIVTIVESHSDDAGFVLEYRLQNTDNAPPTDLTVRIEGVRSGDRIDVTFSSQGMYLLTEMPANGHGVLRGQ